MPHFDSILKGIKWTWIKRMVNYSQEKLDLFNFFIKYRHYNVAKIVKCKLSVEFIEFQSLFYKDVFKCWYDDFSKVKDNCILKEPIWDTQFVTIVNKPPHLKGFIQNCILHVKDLLDNNGKVLSKQNLELKYNASLKQMDYNKGMPFDLER